jgi:pimeloyl-ACP methyl ester carboxylesterase
MENHRPTSVRSLRQKGCMMIQSAAALLPKKVSRVSGHRAFTLISVAALGIAALSIASPGATADMQAAPPKVAVSSWWKAYLSGSRAVQLADGRKINLYCEGSGQPTVVMEAGLGAGASSWHTVQDEIAKTSRVCVYDRAGYFGLSSPISGERSAGLEADDLHAMLRAAHLRPPYVLVGHSLGGYIVRLFAYRHSEDVSGLLLIDPSSEYQSSLFPASAKASDDADIALWRRCGTEPQPSGDICHKGKPPSDLPPDLTAWYAKVQDGPYYSTMAREMEAMNTVSSAQLVAERRSLGSIPVVVLEEDLALMFPAVGAVWHRLHLETLSEISSSFDLRSVKGASHRIQMDKPDIVIAAVQEIVAKARSPGHH